MLAELLSLKDFATFACSAILNDLGRLKIDIYKNSIHYTYIN